MIRLTNLGISKVFVDSTLVLAMGRVEVILDAIVRAPGKVLGDISPLVPKPLVQVKNLLLLILIDRCLVNVRVQVIVPSNSIRQRSC